jgi:hypothetical protein
VFGDGHDEAYTAIVWGVGLSHEMAMLQRPRSSIGAEGNMCGTVKQGPVALPGSEATSRTKGSRRNLGGLTPPTAAASGSGPRREAEEAKPSRKGEESDGVVVPAKRPNKAGMTGGGGRGGKDPARKEGEWITPDSGPSAGKRPTSVALAHGPTCGTWSSTSATLYFREEPGAGKPHAGICAGGGK